MLIDICSLQSNIVPCHASTDVSCLPFFLPTALRLQLHSGTMRLQVRLEERKKYGATSRHLIHDRTLGRKYFYVHFLKFGSNFILNFLFLSSNDNLNTQLVQIVLEVLGNFTVRNQYINLLQWRDGHFRNQPELGVIG